MKLMKFLTAAALLTLCYWLISCNDAGNKGSYELVTVDAPFVMDPIRIYIFPERDFVITDYGAKAGGEFDNTQAIAAAIKACNESGGGRVVVPAGEWFTGAVHLKSNVNIHLEENSILRFSDDPRDYLPAVKTSWEGLECYNYSPLVYAFECENIAITGKGLLSPKMEFWETWFGREPGHMQALESLYYMGSRDVPVEERQMAVEGNSMRPHLIHLNRCKNILLDGFKIRESPFWTIHLFMCDGGVLRNLDVKAHGHNNDGVDVEMTRNILIEDCVFDQGDDAVVLKSGRNRDAWRVDMPTENIVIRNCIALEGHTLLGLGSELSGGIRNVYMHDCEAPESVWRFFFIKTNHRRGGFVENIHLENLRSGSTRCVFQIDTDVLYQWKHLPTFETRLTRIEGIHLTNITCESANSIYDLDCEEEMPARNIVLKNIHVDTVNKFVKKAVNVEGLIEENVTYGYLAK